jgi:hypothetical protein
MNASPTTSQSPRRVVHICKGCKRLLGIQRGPRVHLQTHEVVHGPVVFRCRCKTVTSVDPALAHVDSRLATSPLYFPHVAKEPSHV